MSGILELLSAVGELPRYGDRSFDAALSSHMVWKKVCDGLQEDRGVTSKADAVKYQLRDLGHIEINYNKNTLRVLPAELALLPQEDCSIKWLGPDVQWSAVLRGWRSVGLVSRLKEAAQKEGCGHVEEHLQGQPLLPARVCISGTFSALEKVAQKVRVAFPAGVDGVPTPAAWRVARGAVSVDDLINQHFQASRDLQRLATLPDVWVVVDPKSGKGVPWGGVKDGYGDSFVLRRRTNYDHRLFRRKESGWEVSLLPVAGDPGLARWLLFGRAGVQSALVYDPSGRTLKVSLSARLPSVLTQAVCLCSGTLPTVGNGHIIYSSVPIPIYEIIRQKLTGTSTGG